MNKEKEVEKKDQSLFKELISVFFYVMIRIKNRIEGGWK